MSKQGQGAPAATPGWVIYASAVLGLLTTGLGVYTSAISSIGAERSRQAEIAARVAADQRANLTAERDYQLRLFDKAYEALGSGSERQQSAALALLFSLPDSAARQGVIAAFSVGATGQAQKDARAASASEQQFDQQTKLYEEVREGGAQIAAPSAGTEVLSDLNKKGYDLDLFWCADGVRDQQNLAMARAVGQRLVKTYAIPKKKIAGQAIGMIRLRTLPTSKNAQPDYRFFGATLVFDEAAERAMVETIARDTQTLVGGAYQYRQSPSLSRWYLSAFFCGSPNKL